MERPSPTTIEGAVGLRSRHDRVAREETANLRGSPDGMPPEPRVILLLSALLAAGCAEHLSLRDSDSAGWSTGYLFWPPPPWTSSATLAPPEATSVGGVAEQLASVLQHAGYPLPSVYPIGAHWEHGFALTTRLEKIHDDGTPLQADRWSDRFRKPASLLWLSGSGEPRLPGPGHYRAWLIALTDLSASGFTTRPPRWDERTVMAGSGLPSDPFPVTRPVPPGARIVVYAYEYRADDLDGMGELVAADDGQVTAAAQLRAAGLAGLGTFR
jgi:hypothetical protein